MRDSWRLPALTGLLFALCVASPPARAADPITTTAATIVAGDAPSKGTVTISANAARVAPTVPATPTLPAIGTMTGSITSVSDGTGGLDFHATGDQSLAGGTYDVLSYIIDTTSTVTYSGPVTIRSKGDVSIYGHLRTTAAGATVKIVSSGRVEIWGMGGATPEGIRTTGAGGDITIDGGTIVSDIGPAGTNRAQVTADSGSVTLTSHDVGAALSLIHLDVTGSQGVTVRSAGSMDTWTTTFTSPQDVLVQSFAGGIATNASSFTSNSGNVVVEGSRGVSLTNVSTVHAQGDVTVKSFGTGAGQEVVVDGSTISAFRDTNGGNGTLTVLSSGGIVLMRGGKIEHAGTGDLVVAATVGSVTLDAATSTPGSVIVHDDNDGGLTVSAKDNVDVSGSSQIQTKSSSSRLAVNSISGTVLLEGTSKISGAGGVDVRGSRVSAAKAAGVGPQLTGTSLSLGAGAGGFDLEFGTFDAGNGGANFLAAGPVVLRGTYTSGGSVSVQSTGANIDVSGATIRTDDGGAKASGSITIATFLTTGTINATGATIRTGSSNKTSGDITLAIVTQAMSGGGAADLDGYLLLKSVTVKRTFDPAVSTLHATGLIDTGSTGLDLSGDVVVMVGTTPLAVNLAVAKGKLVHKDAVLNVRVVPRTGSSRAAFTLTTTGDFSSWVDASGSGVLTLRVQHDTFDVGSTVRLSGGRFVLGRVRGSMTEPAIYVSKAKATLRTGALDTLDLAVGFTTDGTTPTVPPELTVTLGTWSKTVASGDFTVRGDGAFVAKDGSGITIVLDYPHEMLTVRGRKVELGDVSSSTTISMTVDGTTRSVAIRMAARGAALVY